MIYLSDYYVHPNEAEPFGIELDNFYNNNAYCMSKITSMYSKVHHAQMLPVEKSSKQPPIYIGAKDLIKIDNDEEDKLGTKDLSHLDRTQFIVPE